jgi:hypothetical protein
MASTLKINTLTGVTTAGSIAVTGEGNSTTTNLQQGLTKAWIDIPEGQASINDSFNVATLTDTGTGDGAVNFTSSFANTTYCVLTGSEDKASSSPVRTHDVTEGQKTTAKYDFETFFVNASTDRTNDDCRSYSGIHGDLA